MVNDVDHGVRTYMHNVMASAIATLFRYNLKLYTVYKINVNAIMKLYNYYNISLMGCKPQ